MLIGALSLIARRFSPELVAKLGHDYTVYAYDFSEYETPLVGQGMLSWILASASSTPNAPADESQTMVTGRVCQNMQIIWERDEGDFGSQAEAGACSDKHAA
jgi:hypothetical protein